MNIKLILAVAALAAFTQSTAWAGSGYSPPPASGGGGVDGDGAGVTDAAAFRSALGLGTAATKNTGTSTGNVIEMAYPGILPAVDASQLTGITASQVSGLGTAAINNTGTSAGNVVQLDVWAKLPAVDGSALTGLQSSAVGLTVTQNSHGFSVGEPVYYSTGGAAWAAARASHAASCATHIVTAVPSANTFVVADSGPLVTTGLTPGAWYVVSPTTAGAVAAWDGVATPYVQRAYQAVTSTLARIQIDALNVQVGGWTMEINVDIDDILTSNGWTGTLGNHTLDTDSYGIDRHKMSVASGTQGAYVTLDGNAAAAGAIPTGSSDAWEVELDWIPNSTSYGQSQAVWRGSSSTSQNTFDSYMSTNTINSASGVALNSAKSPIWTMTGVRQVWTWRKIGTDAASALEWWVNGKLVAVMPYSALGASGNALKAFFLGKTTSASGTTSNYVYAFRSKVGGVMPMPPSARYALGEMRGEP